jgi:uridylate kinase
MGDDPPPADRVLLKLSGELLAGDGGLGLAPKSVDGYADVLRRLAAGGTQLGVVTGGGNFVRGRQLSAFTRTSADMMGMLATVMNAMALADAIIRAGGAAVPMSPIAFDGPTERFRSGRAVSLMEDGVVVVFGGGTGNPYVTTDTAAALRAAQTGCRMLLKGTKVDGVYDSDPVSNPDARRYSRIGYDEVLRGGLGVMDGAAVAICRDAGIPVAVFDITRPENVERVLEDPSASTLIGEEQQ